MALTNAEKQKRWRDRRNALAKRAAVLLAPLGSIEAIGYCSFCGQEGTDLISGTPAGRIGSAFICKECVAACVEIFNGARPRQSGTLHGRMSKADFAGEVARIAKGKPDPISEG